MDITSNIKALAGKLDSQNVTLVAVSKTKPVENILEAYEAGQRDFGENKVQELVAKHEQLPDDIRWHMIGHLQRNKVKYLAPFVYLIHGVDTLRLLNTIDKEGSKCNRRVSCLLQVHIAKEDTKFGMSEEELFNAIDHASELEFVKIKGLMGMATLTDDEAVIREEFHSLKALFEKIKTGNHPNVEMEILSMGMSGDYPIAIECGSNMIRVGSAIFGARN
jgi:pyridoxal phosphate enzyme (YggS family)